MPLMASDVFTCGLMLHELLAGGHPYWRGDQGEYAKLVQSYAAKPPALVGLMPASSRITEVSAAQHRCLSPDPAARPSAVELRAVLSGRNARPVLPASDARSPASATPVKEKSVPDAGPRAASAARTAAEPITSNQLELSGPDGRTVQIGVRTELGKALARQFGADGEFWDHQQCVLERDAGRQWVVFPVSGTTNETLVSGQVVTTRQPLRQGDVIVVGRQAKGVIKLPLMARGR